MTDKVKRTDNKDPGQNVVYSDTHKNEPRHQKSSPDGCKTETKRSKFSEKIQKIRR